MGYRQGLDFEYKEPLPVTCPVLLMEPAGFWSALKMSKWIARGAPVITLEQVTHAQLELAEFVQYEVEEGQKNYDEHKTKAATRMAELFSSKKG
jgi:hypothetical protein